MRLSLSIGVLARDLQQFNRATFQTHLGRFHSVSCNFDVGNKKKGCRPYDADSKTCEDIIREESK